MKLLPLRQVLCTPYNHTPCHFMQSHVCKVYACLAVTCHLYFWRNDRGLLRATAVTQGWNGYQNKSQHRKLTLDKKILLPLLQGFEPATFRSRVRCSNHWAIPTPFKWGETKASITSRQDPHPPDTERPTLWKMASWPVKARGRLMPFRAIQSRWRSHFVQSQNGEE